jgi:hypothetical protein
MAYQEGSTASPVEAAGEALPDFDIGTLRKQYQNFAGTKDAEIKEQRLARHYYHGDQIDAATKKTLTKRKQPILTNNVIGRKIDGVVGLVERMRQDPKAYPRTPKHEDGAETATSVIRYVCDVNDFASLSAEVSRGSAVNGIGGLEMALMPGDTGDQDISLAPADPDCFFYDPRSFRPDFSDARYMGMAKWVDVDLAKEMFPDKADALDSTIAQSGETAGLQQQDRELRWIDQTDKRVFIIEHWYIVGSVWQCCFYTGAIELARFTSPFVDEKRQTICRFIMFSANVDHDGDRYGFVRNMKSPQDEINARRSKGLHQLNTRRIIAERGAVQDVERARTEAARPDGFVEVNPNMRFEFDDASKQADLQGQIEFLNLAKNDIENFGPNPALIGQGIENKSGRAISLLQQAGMAELGPFIIAYRGWKIRVYRAIWNAVQHHWSKERWIRVTDNPELTQFVQLNALALDEYGQPTIQNNLGSLDVDIILDEGPDTITVMQDTLDTLQPLAQKGDVPAEVLLELMSIPSSTKKKLLEMIQKARQPDPQQQQLTMAAAAEEIKNTQADTGKKRADAMKSAGDALLGFQQIPYPVPMDVPDMYGSMGAPGMMLPAAPPPEPAFQPQPQPGF